MNMQGQKIEMQERPRWVFWLVLLGLLAAVIFSIAGGILLGSADLNVSTVIDVIKLKLFGIENEELKRSAISIVWDCACRAYCWRWRLAAVWRWRVRPCSP